MTMTIADGRIFINYEVLYRTRPTSAIEYPNTCKGETSTPKMRTELEIRRISYAPVNTHCYFLNKLTEEQRTLNTPANVNTRPDPAPTRKTAAMLRRNATSALEKRIRGPTRMIS